MSTTTIVTTLNTRTGVLNKKLAAHLLRRASFRFTKDKVDQLANLTAAQAVNNLFNNAAPAPYMPRPLDWETTGDRDWIPQEDSFKETLRRQYVSAWWLQNALLDPTAHHKTVFFLHTNFATSHVGLSITNNLSKHVSRYLFDHLELLLWLTDLNADLKTAASKITRDNLMLGYLNNRTNFASGINENYGREFLELFTIGRGEQLSPGVYENYTEADITLAAQIFSGFTTTTSRNNSDVDPDTLIFRGIADPSNHYGGNKQFSNQFSGVNLVTGATSPTVASMESELEQLVDMVFNQEATAKNFARKIYRFYVSNDVDEIIVDGLADHLISNDFKYILTIKRLLRSEHFFSKCTADYGGGDILKSPIELLCESMSFFDANLFEITDPTDPDQLYKHFRRFGSIYLFNEIGQEGGMHLLGPPSVAGYPAYYQAPLFDKNWYTPGTLPTRYGMGAKLVKFNTTIYTEIDTLAYILHLHEDLNIDVSIADNVVDEIITYLLPQDLNTGRRTLIKDIFLDDLSEQNWFFEWFLYYGGGPQNFPGDGDENRVRPHLDALVIAVLSAQEFQLK